jgi:hypothetical protein
MPYDIDPQLLNLQQQPNFSFGSRLANGAQSFLGNRDLALALLANSGASPQKRGLGEILGTSMLQADQAKQGRADDAFKRAYMQAQMQAMGAKATGPSSVQEYEYAKRNGYKGSYEDWTKLSGQTSRPSSVQEWEFYNALPQEQKQLYLEMKRNPNFQVKDVNQVPTVIAPSVVGGTRTTPLSTLPQIASSAETVKQAEGRGAKVGQTQGEITGGILSKGSSATGVLGMLDDADKLIDDATGSAGGSLVDKGASLVGKSTKGAQAIARLKVIQAGLMLNMPRMEGPQSDRDVQLYREAAASLGEPDVPRETKKAALQQIKVLQQKYQQRAQGLSDKPAAEDPLGIR